MKKIIILLTALSTISIINLSAQKTNAMNNNKESEFYSLKANSLNGKEIDFSDYKGKVVLIVNTASKCGFTPQYEGLQKLHEQYSDKGLVILGFPCNQFGQQEPGGINEIKVCLLNYGVDFQMFEKIEVNGDNTHPVFVYLKKNLTGTLGSNLKWNFTKFLIDKNGKPYKRFAPTTKPDSLVKDIEKLLIQ